MKGEGGQRLVWLLGLGDASGFVVAQVRATWHLSSKHKDPLTSQPFVWMTNNRLFQLDVAKGGESFSSTLLGSVPEVLQIKLAKDGLAGGKAYKFYLLLIF